jgi:DNA-directed RNA polymerase specialized sigma24 family protein
MQADLADRDYEAFYRAHVDEFTRFLAGLLGAQADVRGGRAGVADALQEAMLRILGEWAELQQVDEGERGPRLYRCLRDAAGEALRREHGRRGARHPRPRIVPYDFSTLEADGEELEPGERELTAAVLGAMVRDVATEEPAPERRALLDRGVLLAGLRALTAREAVVLIAVDHMGWEQRELADHLGLEFGRMRETLFTARKLFHGLVRHAIGIDLDDTERARLHAYLAGELTGRERRLARRHLVHCRGCQALVREQRTFGHGAQHLLAPLPFVTGARVLAGPSRAKIAAASAAPAGGAGLFGQAGAAKALAATVAALGAGVGVNAWLSIRAEHQHGHRALAAAAPRPPTRPTSRMLVTRSNGPASGVAHKFHAQRPVRQHPRRPKRSQASVASSSTPARAVTPSTASPSKVPISAGAGGTASSSGSSEFGFEGK